MKDITLSTQFRFTGFDNQGEVFIDREGIYRGIYVEHAETIKTIHRLFSAKKLERFGIVKTELINKNPYKDLNFAFLLKHEKIPFISYPHEWSASMFKDAALFHLKLFKNLFRYQLTLKDWHPYNILFKSTEPIFTDFTSMIPVAGLTEQDYLTQIHINSPLQKIWDPYSKYYYAMHQMMYLSNFLLPLYLFQQRKYQKARSLMIGKGLHIGQRQILPTDVFNKLDLASIKFKFFEITKQIALIDKNPEKQMFFNLLKKEIDDLSISLKRSNYTDYYEAKKENLKFEPNPGWNNKQKVIFNFLKDSKPKTLIDIGSNTGWYSILAAKNGCQVIAIDTDEACIDQLYITSKESKLAILPLVMDIMNPTPEISAKSYKKPKATQIKHHLPLFLKAENRYKCDVVLALGLLHHLVLGLGFSFADIIEILSKFSNKYLIVEFVGIDDKLIKNEPDFFPKYNVYPERFSWYTRQNFQKALKKHFERVTVQPSHPDSRFIFICEK